MTGAHPAEPCLLPFRALLHCRASLLHHTCQCQWNMHCRHVPGRLPNRASHCADWCCVQTNPALHTGQGEPAAACTCCLQPRTLSECQLLASMPALGEEATHEGTYDEGPLNTWPLPVHEPCVQLSSLVVCPSAAAKL